MSGIPEITQPAASGVAVPLADGGLSTIIQSFSGLSVVRHNVSPDVGMAMLAGDGNRDRPQNVLLHTETGLLAGNSYEDTGQTGDSRAGSRTLEVGIYWFYGGPWIASFVD